MQIASFRFTPKLIPTVAAIAAMVFTASLGKWQLNRAAEKLSLQSEYESKTKQAAIVYDAKNISIKSNTYSNVTISGEFDTKAEIFLDNKFHNDKPGYHVITPLRTSNNDYVLINRGWVAEDDRAWLYLCFDEVVVNAMLHGNEGDPRLEIELTVRVDEFRWVVTVSDQGDGFVEAAIPDESQPESLLLEHGRGIRLMQEWLDELTYYHHGSLAWMSRRRADRPTALPISDSMSHPL